MTCIWNSLSHSSFWFRKREAGCSAHWLLAVKLMSPSPVSSPQFFKFRLCYLSSSLAGRLSPGFLFHTRASFLHSTLQPYDITCGPRSDLLFFHTLFLGSFTPSLPSFVSKREVWWLFQREWEVCVWNMFLCVSCTTAGMCSPAKIYTLWTFSSVIKLIAAEPQW